MERGGGRKESMVAGRQEAEPLHVSFVHNVGIDYCWNKPVQLSFCLAVFILSDWSIPNANYVRDTIKLINKLTTLGLYKKSREIIIQK